MTEWREALLGDLFKLKHGFAFKSEFYRDSGDLILLTPGNFRPTGGLQSRGDREKFYEGPVPDGFLLSRGDLLVVMTDLTQQAPILGSAGFVPESDRFLHNQRLGKIVELSSEVEPLFLYSLLNSESVRSQIRSTATGSTVRHTSPERIYQARAAIPPISVQRRIASVLTAYHELIENNSRRIEILEEMTQAIYREWFVKLRYPGHQDDDLFDSPLGPIPEGWTVSRLGDEIELAYGKSLKKDDRTGGEVAVYGSSGVVGWHDTALAPGPGIVVGRKGNVGAVHWSDSDFYPIDTTFYVKTDLSLNYVFHNLRNQNFINSDAAVPGLNRNQAYANPLMVPPTDLLGAFDSALDPVSSLRRNLERQNANLRETRDLLLPRLVSGEIDVSDLDIDTSWLAA